MVALNEERQGIAFPQCRRNHDRDVLGRTLLGVGNLGARNLQNYGTGFPERAARKMARAVS